MTTDALPAYVEDGRPCQVVTVAELQPGDELLGWGGEPFTLGIVESVECVARPTLRGDVMTSYLIHLVGQRGYSYVKGTDYRRIAERGGAVGTQGKYVPIVRGPLPSGWVGGTMREGGKRATDLCAHGHATREEAQACAERLAALRNEA